MRTFKNIIFLFLFFLLSCEYLYSQEIAVPVETQIPLFFKIISFDRTILKSGNKNFEIVIIYQKNYKYSQNIKNEILSVFENNSGYNNFNGKNIEINSLSINQETDLDEYLAGHKADCVFLTPLRALNIELLVDILIKKKTISFSTVPDYVNDGICFGLEVKGERPNIIINLPTSKSVGAEFNSQLLKISKVIE